MYYYSICGLRLASEWTLPELVPIPPPQEHDIFVRSDTLPSCPPDLECDGAAYWREGENIFLLFAGAGVFGVIGSSGIVVDAEAGAEESRLRLFILGAAMAALLHNRGLTVLHGSAAAIHGRGAVFIGHKGWGKSTTVAALHQKGFRILSDDVVALRQESDGTFSILPTFPQIKLWPNAIASFGIDPESLPRLSLLFEKRHCDASASFSTQSIPLDTIYALRVDEQFEILPLPTAACLLEIICHTYVSRYGSLVLDNKASAKHLVQSRDLLAQTRLMQLKRPADLASLPRVAAMIEADICQAHPHQSPFNQIKSRRPLFTSAE
jgi:hypothetical protein